MPVEHLPLSVQIVEWDLDSLAAAEIAAKRIEELYRAGYSIVASGSSALRDSPPPRVRNPYAVAWLVMSTRGDLQP